MTSDGGRRSFAQKLLAMAVSPFVINRWGRSARRTTAMTAVPLSAAAAGARTAPEPTAKAQSNVDIPRFFRDERVVRLVESKPMLRGFGKLVYEHIRDAVKAVESVPPPFVPYLYESLLSDVAKLLDRCLAYRRECSELEALAVRRALEFELIGDLYPKQNELQQLITATSALEGHRDACESAGAAFVANDGFKTLYKKTAEALVLQKGLEDNKRIALTSILKLAYQHQQLLEARHTEPGHSLNYAERRERILNLLVQDVAEAYQKARAAKAGLECQLGIVADARFPFPAIVGNETDVSLLDRLVLWTRSVAQGYDIRSQEEVVFDRIIPLVFPWTMEIDQSRPKSVVTAATFTNAISGDGRLTFSIKDALPTEAQVKYLRVRSIGLSAGAAVGQDFWSAFPKHTVRTWSCAVMPPPQRDPYRPDQQAAQLARGTVLLGRVGIFRADVAPEMNGGAAIWNVDPRAGDWNIVVDRLMNHPYSAVDTNWGTWPRAKDVLTDLKLHLRLVGKPSGNAGDWITA